MNLGAKALLSWATATIAPSNGSSDTNLELEDLLNGELLLKLVYILKNESSPCISNCVEERFKIIADFVERDCRFNACNGSPISWRDILDGKNLSTEMSKILLLLVYHDLMNDHCTFGNIDTDTESQIAILTETYVMESEGRVSLKPEIDTDFPRQYMKTNPCDFDKSCSTPGSSVSSYDESPVFVRSHKVKFVDMDSVASSSVSCSPIQNIMNTPKFQLRKLQRQMLEDRDFRDLLEKDLSQKIELLAQRESQINRLQYFLDKLKKEQGVSEQMAKEQLEQLENKNNQLQSCFNEVLKQNKELKGDSSLMERQVDKLTEENGELSFQMRSVCAKLANFQAEVDRLRETQNTNEEEWRSTTCNLQTELNDARAKKGDLLEQIEILKGRISCLEDQISRATHQEEGDNMWISVEKVILEKKICVLTDELDDTTNSLRKAEVEVLAKTQQLKDCEKEISDHKELHKEMAEVREVLQQEISTLKLHLEKAEQEKCEQTKRLELHLESCAQEMEKLIAIKQQKEEILFQTEEKIKDLMTKLCAANNLIAEKDKEVCKLTEKVDSLVIMHQQAKEEAHAKDEMFSQLLVEKSQEEGILQSNIQFLKDQVNSLKSSLKEAEDSLQTEKNLFSQTHQEKCGQIEMLHNDIVVCKSTIETLKNEIQVKDDQLMEIQDENSTLSQSMQEEISVLKGQINDLCKSLMEAKQQVQTQQTELTQREEENSHQKEILQKNLSSSEEMVRSLKDEINAKTYQISSLENQSSEQSELLKTEINDLQQQLKSLQSHLTNAQEDLSLKENDFALKLREIEELQTKVSRFQDEIKTLQSNVQAKEEEFCQLKRETSTEMDHLKYENRKQSQALEHELQRLHSQVKSLKESLNFASQELQVKEEMLAGKEIEMSCEKDMVQNLRTTLEEEIHALKQQILTSEEQLVTLKNEADRQSNLHQQEKLSLKTQLDEMAVSLSKAEEQVQTQLQILTEQELKTAQEQERLQKKLVDSQTIIGKLETEIHDKEHQMEELETHGSEQSRVLMEKNECLQRQLESLSASLKDTEEKMHFKETLLTQKQQENELKQQEICDLQVKMEQTEKQMLSCKQENNQLQVDLSEKGAALEKSQEQCHTIEQELSSVKIKMAQNVLKLEEDAVTQAELMHKAKEDFQNKDDMLNQLEERTSQKINTLQNCVETLKEQLEDCSRKLVAKEEELLKIQLESSQQIDNLNQELVSLNTDLNQQKELHTQDLRKNEEILTQKQQENELKQQEICELQVKMEQAEKQMFSCKQENNQLQVDLSEKNDILERSQEKCQTVETELSALRITVDENHKNILKLREDAVAQAELIQKAKEDVLNKDNLLNELKAQTEEKMNMLQNGVETLKGQLEDCSQKLVAKEEELLNIQAESSMQIDNLNQELVSLNTNLNQQKELHTQALRKNEEVLTQKQQENERKICDLQVKMEQTEKQMLSCKQENNQLQVDLSEKDALLEKSQEQCQKIERELSAVKINMDENNKNILKLREDAVAQAELIHKAKEDVQNKDNMLNELKAQTAEKINALEQCAETLKGQLEDYSQKLVAKEDELLQIQAESEQQIENLNQELVSLKTDLNQQKELHTQNLRTNEEILTQKQQEDKLKQQELCDLKVQKEQVEKQMLSLKHENNQLQVDLSEKEAILEKSQEQCQTIEQELSAVKIKMAEHREKELKLREDAVTQAELIHKAKEEVLNKDNMLNELKDQTSQKMNTLQHCVETLKGQLEDCSQNLVAKEEELLKIQLESSQQMDNLNQELVSLKTDLNQQKELHTQNLRTNEEMLDSATKERDDLVKEKGNLNSKLELLVFENQKLAQAKMVLERENSVAQNLHTKLQQDLEILKEENNDLLKEKENMEDIKTAKEDFLEQLAAKSTAAEHYKAQMEKAMSHYNGKKQLLQQSEEVVANLKQSLEVQEHEAKTATMENKILQMELDKIQSNEKLLLNKIASLEAQLSFADKALREQNKIPLRASTLDLPRQHYEMHTKVRSMSADSLDQSSADDSLNTTRKLCAPGEASTPLVRSSERLAAKRKGIKAESLETLYFTPINTRHRPEESAKKSSASSVKRRRTTQVINITLTKKTPGREEAESFYNMTSARSHPNLCGQGISTELFATPAKVPGSDPDQLIGLPGYRRSTIHSQAASTFCVGAENEPEGGPEDWMRIAEIQARNKACLPHLKSSYPVEFDSVHHGALTFTDEDLRTGDPIETIRRASVMPGQLQDSLQTHRLSYMVGQGSSAATARSRLSLMPGQDIPLSSTLRSPKGTKRPPSTLTLHTKSPEKKHRASCFPRPLTPKNKNVHIQAALSPADRRESMMFTIDNTPRKDLLKKGLSKLRSSTRKSPGKALKKSPAQSSNRRGQENIPAKNGRAAVGGAGRMGTSKGPKKSPQVSTRAAKSPGITASARKMMSRMKV